MDFVASPPRILRPIVWRQRIRRRILSRAEVHSEASILKKAASADVVYLSKVLSLSLYERLKESTTARIVLDFGDSVWLYNDGANEHSFQQVLRIVDAVTTDNARTAEYVRQFNSDCTVIPDSPQLEEFDRRRSSRTRSMRRDVVLGWLGTPSTLFNLYEIWEALEIIGQRHPDATIRLVGAGHDPNLRPAFERIRYSIVESYDQNRMIDEVLDMDIGLFPLQNVERSRVRGVLKAAIYMCGEAAVVASPVGQVVDVIRNGENGLLAGSRDEWVRQLERVILDRELRLRLTAEGLTYVRQHFRTEESWLLLKSVLLGR